MTKTEKSQIVNSINSVMDSMWERAGRIRRRIIMNQDEIQTLREQADELSGLLQKYEAAGLNTVPQDTIWLAHTMLDAVNSIILDRELSK